jgi:hypothetical protein
MEGRKPSLSKPSPLPVDYLKMVTEVFQTHFDGEIKLYLELKPKTEFMVRGAICADEIWIAVSLVTEGQLSAPTVYASSDFDPKASSPTAQDLLSACVDSAASVFGSILDESRPETVRLLAEDSSAVMDQFPISWAPMEVNQREIFVRLDRTNPMLENITDEWLSKNDPETAQLEKETEDQVKDLFFTGPRQKPGSARSIKDAL